MIEVRETGTFSEWLSGLRGARARAEVARPGATPGARQSRRRKAGRYRVYYVQRGSLLIILLCGGNKSAQAKDMAVALKLAKEV